MRDVLPALLERWQAGEQVGLGSVVATFESAPREPGAAMLVGSDGAVVGSVSGGCVEAAVYDLAVEALATGRPVLERYGVNDEDAFAAGLTCGGIIDVFVERVDRRTFPELERVVADVAQGRTLAVATVVHHPDLRQVGRRLLVGTEGVDGELGSRRLTAAVVDGARGLLAAGRSRTLSFGPDGERQADGVRVFVNALTPPPRLLVFGAIDYAAALAQLGSFLGYRVSVCDARPVFATTSRFPAADEVIVDWPHRYLAAEAAAGRVDARTAICVLTHDAKFDIPLLTAALRLPDVGFVGAMGSRRTHERRLAALREVGLTDGELARLSSPIGLDLGARTPEETAVSIGAELVALRWGGTGQRLTRTTGPLHR